MRSEDSFWYEVGIWGIIMALSFFTVLGIGTFIEWVMK